MGMFSSRRLRGRRKETSSQSLKCNIASLYSISECLPYMAVANVALWMSLWGLADAAGPFETLRKHRIDEDERRKDREWRESLDRARQEIDLAIRHQEQGLIAAQAESARLDVLQKRFEFLCQLVGEDRAREIAAAELMHGREIAGPDAYPPPELPPPDTS